jgi:hypothetical protein
MEQNAGELKIRYATQAEYDQIHKLNHEILLKKFRSMNSKRTTSL